MGIILFDYPKNGQPYLHRDWPFLFRLEKRKIHLDKLTISGGEDPLTDRSISLSRRSDFIMSSARWLVSFKFSFVNDPRHIKYAHNIQ